VGRAAVRPGSDTFVWEQSPPYDTLSDYGAGISETWWGSDFEIWTVGPDAAVPRRLFQPHALTTYVLGGFSKDGRFLALLATRNGKVKLAVYDFRRQRLSGISAVAEILADRDGSRLRLVGQSTPGDRGVSGRGPWQFTFRRAIGDRLTASWAKSWDGKEPSVDQYDSLAGYQPGPFPAGWLCSIRIRPHPANVVGTIFRRDSSLTRRS
jgi:hypothetical protein